MSFRGETMTEVDDYGGVRGWSRRVADSDSTLVVCEWVSYPPNLPKRYGTA